MRRTLLEMTQLILSAMDSDEVNSITDTVESYQVAQLIQQVYYDIASELQLPEDEAMFQLTASGDNTLPCLMTIPNNVIDINSIQYDNKVAGDTYSNWQPIRFCPLNDFISMQNTLKDRSSNVVEMSVTSNSETFKFLCASNDFPKYYTTFNDSTLLFDSYKSTEDTTLQSSKTLCDGAIYTAYILSDTFTPSLSPDQFSYFLNKAKTRAFFEIKQVVNNEAVAETREQKLRLQKGKRLVPGLTELERTQRYGRK